MRYSVKRTLNIDQAPMICPVCGREYKGKRSLKSHMTQTHTDPKDTSHRGRPKGGQAWNKGLTKKDDPRIPSNKTRGFTGKSHSSESKQMISKALSQNNHGGRCSWYLVNGMNVQGTWERDFALKMNELGIVWEKVKKHAWKYEMDGRIRHYTPDFYLPSFDLYVEIKGHWWGDDERKMKLVLEQHKDKKIIVLMKEQFEKVLHGELVW